MTRPDDPMDRFPGYACAGERSGGLSRRQFFKLTAGGALALYAFGPRGIEQLHAAPIPGGTLAPGVIGKFVTPLLIPPAMPYSVGTHVYDITVAQFSQQILPAGLPPTTVWGYGATADLRTVPDGGTLNYPSFTIESLRDATTTVTWRNGLVNGGGSFLRHLLPVDPTLHWANPEGGTDGRDTRPDFTGMPTPGPYTGPVPIVTHVHGMGNVADWSDGYAEAWFLPDANDIPGDYATVGTWYEFFEGKAAAAGVTDWGPGRATFRYPNDERPSTAWYHDHTLGMTRLNVYAGPAGFYNIRSGSSDDNPTVAGGAPAVLPGPAPQVGDDPNTAYYEIPLAIQDRSFNADGSLFYPNTRAFFDGYAGPYIPTTDVSPIWNAEFFGNCMVVNGNAWPKLDVAPRRYRFRLLNGCNSRFLVLRFDDPKVDVWQIGTEGGFLRAPVNVNEILMGPAERADVIVDFSRVKFGKSTTLENRGPDAPFAGGGFRRADPQSTGLVMRFDVAVPLTVAGPEDTTPPAQLVMPAAPSFPAGTTRPVALLEQLSQSPGVPPIPVETILGTFDPAAGVPAGIVAKKWADAVSENPKQGDSETWEIYNFTVDAHPIHIHEVFFEVVNRQPIDPRTGTPVRAPRPAGPTENGYKDTVIAYPGEVTRVRMTFSNEGQYTWHCHIVEHEDNEMMRPYAVGTPQNPNP